MLERVRSGLEQEIPVYLQDIPPEDRTTLANFNLTTAKPIMVVLNVSEDAVGDVAALEAEWHAAGSRRATARLSRCARTSRRSWRSCRTTRNRSSAPPWALASRAATGLLKRHTRCWVWCLSSPSGRTEVRAWTIARATPAQRAAGKVHSDIERGFIRAEVVTYNDLMAVGGLVAARKAGNLRSEGKTYPVQDGDIINFLFSV